MIIYGVNMIIKEIIDINSKKSKIVTDNGIAFVLYKGDLSKYNIVIGEVEDETIEEIFDRLLPKRALDRSLKILTGRDVTEGMLKDKLKQDGYFDDIIDKTIERLKKERLLDDERYVRGYIEGKSNKKSKRDVIIALSQKGIPSEFSEKIYNELKEDGYLCDEEELIKKILIKRNYNFDEPTYEEKQKQIRYLLSKGFSYDSIHSVINIS